MALFIIPTDDPAVSTSRPDSSPRTPGSLLPVKRRADGRGKSITGDDRRSSHQAKYGWGKTERGGGKR